MKTNTLRNLMFFGVAALPAVAMAGPPLDFGSTFTFSTSAGVQTVNHALTAAQVDAGWSKGANPIVDDGFLQVTLTAPDGSTYFQTIIGGGGAQGTDGDTRGVIGAEFFSTESFVKVNAAGGQGIAADQIVDDLRGGNFGTLVSDSVILTGSDFLQTPATEATVELSQSVTDSESGNVADAGFTAGFGYNAYLHDLDGIQVDGQTVLNDRVGSLNLSQVIDSKDGDVGLPLTRSFADRFDFASISRQDDGQAVPVEQVSSLSINTQVNLGVALDDQDFQYEKRAGADNGFGSGSANYAGGRLAYEDGIAIAGVDAAGQAGFFEPTPTVPFTAGDSIDWVVGDTVDRVYIAQSVDNAGDFGFASLADRGNLGAGDNYFPADDTEYQSIFSLADGGHPPTFYSPETSNPFDQLVLLKRLCCYLQLW